MKRRLVAIALLCFVAAGVSAEGVKLPAFKRVELDNGTVLLLNEKHDVPLIGLQAVVRGGAVADPAGKNGVAALLAEVLQKGAGDRDAAAFAEAVDSVGGELSAYAGLEGISISAEFLARDADLMVELVADMLQRPALEPGEVDKVRTRRINSIRAAKDGNLGALTSVYGSAFLFGEHPYGNPINGSESTLAEISHDDLIAWYEQHVGSDRLIIAVSGDFETNAMQQRLAQAFGEWRPASAALPGIEPAPEQSGTRVLLVDKPGASQTYFLLANTGVSIHYPQRADLNLANTLFGGRYTSMLNTALRVESGLTYGARSRLMRPSQPGAVAITSYTRTDATIEAIDMALDVLDRLHAGALTPEMIDSGRNYIVGQFPTILETAGQLAGVYATLENYGLGADYIDGYGEALAAATPESVAAVIEDVYPTADNLVFVILGDAEIIREQVARYGPVTELAISEPRFRP